MNRVATRAIPLLRPSNLLHRCRLFATMNETPPKPYRSHEERTAKQPRDPNTHEVIVSQVALVNRDIRILRLTPKVLERQVKFLPGQWLDVHVPGLSKAGGFTLTSTPADADLHAFSKDESTLQANKREDLYQDVVQHLQIDPESRPFLELAIQHSPRNPPAAWLWGSYDRVVGAELMVRVGGNFTWPPPGISSISGIRRLVLVAGGVGINPLISILRHLHCTNSLPRNTTLLYSTKIPDSWIENSQVNLPLSMIPFLSQIISIGAASPTLDINNFLTGTGASSMQIPQSTNVKSYYRRMSEEDLVNAVGEDVDERKKSLAYVCGPQRMTDEIVAFLEGLENMRGRVLCERWW